MTPGKYRQFIFESYRFDSDSGKLELRYSLDKTLSFTEDYRFDFPFADYDPDTLDRALQLLFLMAGVSYYKTYIPGEIVADNAAVDRQLAEFFGKTYQRGLGEFWYVNQLDPSTPVIFPETVPEPLATLDSSKRKGLLAGLGGGKDSLTSVELLRGRVDNLSTWSLSHRSQLAPLVDAVGLPHYSVERQWDPQLKSLTALGAYNGHVPISAIFACVGVVAAILSGKRDVVTSNERSANEPTLEYRGVAINHQYSKSAEFEQDFQAVLRHLFGDSVRYYSLLRPLSELKIAEIFSSQPFQKYKNVFSSCNRAFIHTSERMSWCGECSKCAFTFLALTPFVPRNELESLFGGKNLLLDAALEPTYLQLLGIEGDKPLECVGEIQESRTAMQLIQKQYPELKKYRFELTEGYDFQSLEAHTMPPEIYSLFADSIQATA